MKKNYNNKMLVFFWSKGVKVYKKYDACDITYGNKPPILSFKFPGSLCPCPSMFLLAEDMMRCTEGGWTMNLWY